MTVTREPAGVDALTVDGAIVTIRPTGEADAAALSDLFARASAASLQLRFFTSPGGPLLDAEVRRLVRPLGPQHGTIVAELAGELVGVSSYERSDDDSAAEFAVIVADEHQGRGIGTLLLEHLARHARHEGVAELYGEVLAGNTRMLRAAGDLAARSSAQLPEGVIHVAFATDAEDAALTAIEERERAAGRASLRSLLAPRSVAVVGAGRSPGGVGRELFTGLVRYGFSGAVYPVNPHADEIDGVRAYPSLTRLPEPAELVVIATPAAVVPGVITDAAASGTRAVVVVTTGFSEAGAEGQASLRQLVHRARAAGIRVVGPSCLGVVNTDPQVRLDASFAPEPPPQGGLAVATQSSAVGLAVLERAARTGCGISTFVSLGTKADVSGNDLLSYWHDDPHTQAVALYLESFGNPRKFARIARTLARRKPVLAVFSGRPEGGQRGAESGTAIPASAVETLFAQAGVLHTDQLGEMIDAARVLTGQPLPAGSRLALVSNAGGANALAADAAEAAGLELPDRVGGMPNPLDLGAAASPGRMAGAMSLLAGSGAVDAVVAMVATTRTNDPPGMWDAVAAIADAYPQLPLAGVTLGADRSPLLGKRGVPVFDLPERAVAALGHAARYAAWRREPIGSRPRLERIDPATGRRVIREALGDGAGWQPYERTRELLAAYGVRLADQGTTSETEAAQRADGGVEMVVGVVNDPLFGSLVRAGLGGVHTELLGDRTYRLVPMTDLDAARMWRSLRSAPLLTGYGGSEPVDTDAVEDLLLRVGRLAEDVPEVAELELRPVLAGPGRVVVVAATLRLAPVGVQPEPTLRSLHPPA